MPKWVYPLAFLFVLFLIYTDPSGAGEFASGFASFVVDMLSAVGEFLTGLFEGASGDATSVATTVQSNAPSGGGGGGTGTTTATTIVDSFTHTHDGSTHTHMVGDN